MANKTANNRILRAMSIGIAAMMAIQPVLATPVFAEENDNNNDENKYSADAEHESVIADEARESVDSAEVATMAVEADVNNINVGEAGTTEVKVDDVVVGTIDNVQAIQDSLMTDVPVFDENGVKVSDTSSVAEVLEQVSDNLNTVDVELTIAEAKKNSLAQLEGIGDENAEAQKANEAVIKASVAIEAGEGANEQIQKAVDKGNEKVEATVKQYQEGVKIVDEAEKEVADAEIIYTNLVNTVSDATSVAEAQKAYDELGTLVSDTQASIEDKQKALDAARNTLSELLDSVKACEKDAEDARKAFDEAQANYLEAKDEYDTSVVKADYEHRSLAIKEFNDAYKIAKDNLEKAEDNLEVVTEKAEALSTAVDNAQDAIEKSGAISRAGSIVDSKTNAQKIKNESGNFWPRMDDMFASIMRNYYLPEVLGATEIESMYWNKFGSNDLAKIDKLDVSKGNDYNYCIVTYKDAEGEHTKYFNYKRESGSKYDIVIFEKRPEEVDANRKLNQGQKVEGVEQNKNFYDYVNSRDASSVSLVQANDKGFNAFLSLGERYQKLANDAATQKAAVEEATENVNALSNVVKDLRKLENGKEIPESLVEIQDLPGYIDKNEGKIKSIIKTLSDLGVDFGAKKIEELTLDDIKNALDKEQERLDGLKDRVKELTDSMDEVADKLAETIDRINSESNGNTPSGDESNGDENVTERQTAIVTPLIIEATSTLAEIPSFVMPVGGIDEVGNNLATSAASGVAGVRRGIGTSDELDDGTLIGAGIDIKLPVKEDDNELALTKDKAVKTIVDEDVPLASFPQDGTKKMSWWWLLIIALLGATGEEMYRRSEKKEEEQ